MKKRRKILKYEKDKRYEKSILNRIEKHGSKRAAINSFKSADNEGTKKRKEFLAQKRFKLTDYCNCHKDFKEELERIVKLTKHTNEKNKTVYGDGYKKENDLIAYNYKRAGLKKNILARHFRISVRCLDLWLKKHDSFREAWEMGEIDEYIEISSAVSETAKFFETEIVKKEEGFIEVNGEQVPINKTITTTIQHAPINASVKRKLDQFNNRQKKKNNKLLGYIPPNDKEETGGATVVIKHDSSFVNEKDFEKLKFIEDEPKEEEPKEEEQE